ncbi:MAG: hypothetical protein ACRD3W_16000 [Terriglobales bacterium]
MAKFIEFENLSEDQAKPITINVDLLISIQPHDIAGELSEHETKIITTNGTYLITGNYKAIMERVNKT